MLMILSALLKRFSVSRMLDFFYTKVTRALSMTRNGIKNLVEKVFYCLKGYICTMYGFSAPQMLFFLYLLYIYQVIYYSSGEYKAQGAAETICLGVLEIGQSTKWSMVDFDNVKGSGTQARMSPVSDYQKNWPSLEVLDFEKDISNVKISNLEPKKKWCFSCECFLRSHIIRKLFPQR